MKQLIHLFVFSLLAVMFTSCDKDDEIVNPFIGTDNYITSFTLTKDGAQYNGYISDNQIIVYAPLSQSLEGAVATVKVCEQATVFPDPAGISDWDNERQFKVTAYNESEQTYTYRVVRSSETTQENIVLATQQEVDDFKNSDIVRIMGTLTVGSDAENAEPITNLDGLSNLKEVSYDIKIVNYSGEDIAGLGNLEIAGGLHIENATALKTLSLPKLIKAPVGGVSVTAETLENVSLPALTETGSLYIRSYNLSSLDFPALATVHGDLTLNVNKNINNLDGLNLTGTIEQISFPVLKECGNIQIAGFAAVTTIGIPMLESVGNLSIEWIKKLETLSLPQMKTAKDIYIHATNIADELDFKSLTTINGDMHIYASKIADCTGLSALRTVNGQLLLESTNFENLNGLTEVTINGGVRVDKNASYTCLDLSRITVPNGSTIEITSNCSTIDELIFPETLESDLYLGMGARVTSLTVKGVKKAGYIEVSVPKNLAGASTMTFDDLTTVYTLTVKKNTLTAIKCPSLSTIESELSIISGSNLTELNFDKLENLKESWSSITIQSNKKLTDFSTFSKLFENTTITESQWNVTGNAYNPTFDEMKAGRYTQQ